MSTQKRPRGRPRGPGKDDSAMLGQVAALLVRHPTLKPSTAMRRVMKDRTDRSSTDETLLRRLQVKWHDQGPQLLAKARLAGQPLRTTNATMNEDISSVPSVFTQIVDQHKRISDLFRPSDAIQRLMDEQKRISDLFRPSDAIQRLMDEQKRFSDLMRPSDAIQRLMDEQKRISDLMRPSDAIQRLMDEQKRFSDLLGPRAHRKP